MIVTSSPAINLIGRATNTSLGLSGEAGQPFF